VITAAKVFAVLPSARKGWPEALASAMNDAGISKGDNAAMFLAQIGHESAGLTLFSENLNYSASRLMVVWPRRFPTLASAAPYARAPAKLANHVYALRMGNGSEATGDGWRYRGRGPIQITGKSNYAAASQGIQVDILRNPDLVVSDPSVGSRVACWFWNSNGLPALAAQNRFSEITRKINGGLHGMEDRRRLLEIARKVL
jgi:putative chitinase